MKTARVLVGGIALLLALIMGTPSADATLARDCRGALVRCHEECMKLHSGTWIWEQAREMGCEVGCDAAYLACSWF